MKGFLLVAMAAILVASCGGGQPQPEPSGSPSAPTVLPPQGAGTALPAGNAQDLVTQAQAALDAGKLPDAERLFKQAIGAGSKSAEAQFGLGNVYFRQGRLAEAETAYLAAIAADPNLTAAHSNLGVVYYQQGQMQKAEDEFNAALKLKPDDAATLYLLAAVHIQNNQLADAETLLNQAKTIQPNLAEVYYGLGALYNLQGKKTEAIAAFEKFLALGTAQDPQAMDEARKQLKALKGQ
ncbi:MAG: tetratricopeptide repeat protein [Nitrososphaerales archaeon]